MRTTPLSYRRGHSAHIRSLDVPFTKHLCTVRVRRGFSVKPIVLCCGRCRCTSLVVGFNNQHFSIVSVPSVGSLKRGEDGEHSSLISQPLHYRIRLLLIPRVSSPMLHNASCLSVLVAAKMTRRGLSAPLPWEQSAGRRAEEIRLAIPLSPTVGTAVASNQTQRRTSLTSDPPLSDPRVCIV